MVSPSSSHAKCLFDLNQKLLRFLNPCSYSHFPINTNNVLNGYFMLKIMMMFMMMIKCMSMPMLREDLPILNTCVKVK